MASFEAGVSPCTPGWARTQQVTENSLNPSVILLLQSPSAGIAGVATPPEGEFYQRVLISILSLHS